VSGGLRATPAAAATVPEPNSRTGWSRDPWANPASRIIVPAQGLRRMKRECRDAGATLRPRAAVVKPATTSVLYCQPFCREMLS
jgi:hypothetical protein